MEKNIETEVLETLRSGFWELDFFKINGILPRNLYMACDKVIKACGGKWSRKLKAHVFSDDDGAIVLRASIESGKYVDQKKMFQFFETPEELAHRMVKLAIQAAASNPMPAGLFLEPSCGRGRILDAMERAGITQIVANDIDSRNISYCSGKFPKIQFTNRSFLNLTGEYSCIIQNPPFSKLQDLSHICHAISLLKPGGILVSISSTAWSFRDTTKVRDFNKVIHDHANIVMRDDLPSGTFSESGTEVRSTLWVIRKK